MAGLNYEIGWKTRLCEVEDITSDDVSKYKYTLNFNPKMWLPVEIDTVD